MGGSPWAVHQSSNSDHVCRSRLGIDVFVMSDARIGQGRSSWSASTPVVPSPLTGSVGCLVIGRAR